MTQIETPGTELSTGKWKRYPAYKDSGVEWLGEIPEHWKMMRIAMAAKKITNGYVGPTRDILVDEGIRYLQSLHIKNGRIRFDKPYYVNQDWSSAHSKSILCEGDVLVVQTGDIGQCCVVTKEFVGCNCHALIIIQLKDGLGSGFYLSAILRSDYGYNMLRYYQTGALHPHLECGNVREIKILLPPPIEQTQIMDYLDHETAQINALIAKKERMIELLQEKRSALISHAVTKGLDPEASMKDSGVEWLGEIPEHWEVKRLKFLADVLPGVAKGRDLGQRDVVELPYLRVANVQDGYLDLSDIATTTVGIDEVDRYLLQPNDVLMNEGGDFDKLGRGYVWDGSITPCLHQNHVFAVRPHTGINPYWINIITLTSYAKHYFILKSKQSTNLASISGTNLKELPVLMPPEAERNTILAYITNTTAQIDALISRIRDGIEKLKEYSTAIISAAVTGKIDVRETISDHLDHL